MGSLLKIPNWNTNLKIISEAQYIQDGATVTKKTGTKEYTLRRSIKIYGENQQEIKCDTNTVFLVDCTGNINLISESTELVLHVLAEDLLYDLQYDLEDNK